ncbi:MAG: mechanosensitive ion channel domain-containing protein [Lentisphaerota bacterium]
MNIQKLFVILAFIFITSLCPSAQFSILASDTPRIEGIRKQLEDSRQVLNEIKSHINDDLITDNQLAIYRHKLKEIDSVMIQESSYFKEELHNDKDIIADLSALGLNDKNLKTDTANELYGNITQIYSEIDQYSNILIQVRLFEGHVSNMLNLISDKQIKIRSKDLFIYNHPFYRVEAWGAGKKDILDYLGAMAKEFTPFIQSIIMEGWKATFIFVITFIFLISFITIRLSPKFKKTVFGQPIKYGHLEITRYRDVFHTRGFITLLLFLRNAVLPSLLLLLLEHSFYMNYGYESTNKWVLLIWNLTTSIIYIFSLHTIVNMFFDKRLGFLPEVFTDSKKFRRRWLVMVYQVAILFTINDIDIMDISININPIFSLNGTALLNLIMGLTISYNIFILSPKIKHYLSSAGSTTEYSKFYTWIINLLILGALIMPALVFIGASNLFIGLILNLTQCFLIIFFFWVAYSILRDIHPILSRNIVEFLYRASAETGEDEEKFSHIDHKTPIFTYWLNFLILAVFSIITAILFLLIWGVPPDVVSDWASTAFFKGIPLGNQNTFPLSYLLRAIALSIVVYYIFKGIQSLAESKVLPYTSMDNGTQKAVITTIGYMGVVFSVVIFVYALGINMTALTFIISGLSVGIGFALQEFFKNFFSGFVLLIERPIKVGDLLLYNKEVAEVKKIRIRSTELVTFSRVTLIVPNSELVNNTVVNETISATTCITIRIGISYDAEPNAVIAILIKAATSTENVFAKPHPTVDVTDFADSAINYELKAFTKRALKVHVASEIRKKIYSHLKEANIEIPYPQRDIRIRSIVDTNIFSTKKETL